LSVATSPTGTSRYKLYRQLATAVVLFRADQTIAGLPFQGIHAKTLSAQFGFSSFTSTVPADPQSVAVWRGRKGVASVAPERRLVIEDLIGNEQQVYLTVEGETADAIDALQEVWAALCELGNVEPSSAAPLGTLAFGTAATVELPFTYEKVFPAAAILEEHAARVGGSRIATTGVSAFRLSITFPSRIGGTDVSHEIALEPRLPTSSPKDRVYFTASPLKTDDHAACSPRCASASASDSRTTKRHAP